MKYNEIFDKIFKYKGEVYRFAKLKGPSYIRCAVCEFNKKGCFTKLKRVLKCSHAGSCIYISYDNKTGCTYVTEKTKL